MAITLLIEEMAGQHESMKASLHLTPYCRCDGGPMSFSDSCFRCGRHVRGTFKRGEVDGGFERWTHFIRERP